MKTFLSIIIIIILHIQLFSQNQISGKITDAETGLALFNVNVFIPELQTGAFSDSQGNYRISYLPKGKIILEYSYVGYKTVIKTIKIVGGEMRLDIGMNPAVIHSQGVVISGGSYSSQHEYPTKIETLNAKEIRVTGNPSFIKAIATLPGIDVISKSPGISKPVIRGLSNTNILMLNNGVKLQNFQFSVNHPYLVNEFGVGKVEVIKGPASLLYGSDAVGGVINILREKPAPYNKIIGDFNVRYYSNTTGMVSNLGIKGNINGFIWGIRGGMISNADYYDGNRDFVPNTRFNNQSIKANIGMIKPVGTFNIYYDFNRDKLGMTVEPSIALVKERGRKNDVWYQDLTDHLISLKNKIFLGNLKLDINAALQMNDRKLQTSDLTPAFTMVHMDLTAFSYDIKTYLPSDEKSEYILGLQGMFMNNKNHETPSHVLPDANSDETSLFGLLQHTFFNKLRAQVGFRYDYRHIYVPKQEAQGTTNNGQSDMLEELKRNYGNFSGSIGATYNMNEKLLFRLNFASGYRTPNLAELTQDGMHGDRYEQGNRNLNSQRNYEVDINIHYHSDLAQLDLSGFYNRIRDYIFLAPTNDTTENGVKIFRYLQTNAALYGFETIMEIYPKSWLNAKANYSFIIGREDDGNYLPFIPQNKFNLELKVQQEKLLVFQRTYLFVRTEVATKQNHPAMFETDTDGYFLLSCGVGGQIKWSEQKVSFDIIIDNLLNETYIDHLSTLKDLGYYNMGRNISVSLKIPFGIK